MSASWGTLRLGLYYSLRQNQAHVNRANGQNLRSYWLTLTVHHARQISTTPMLSETEFRNKFESSNVNNSSSEEEEFRVYKIDGLKKEEKEKRVKRRSLKPQPPRFRSMATDQDWTDVWPTAATFKWSAVPFPVRQGFIKNSGENEGVVPSKYANLELMKGPNFLHLTPAHIKKHCAALRQFCTQWPEGLETDDICRKHFPLETITSDYVFASPSIQQGKARVATLKFCLSDLNLDYHAKDKFIRLVGERYDKQTDTVVLESGRCPLKSQNMEFLKFVLTAVYFESLKREAWEDLKQLSDMERYFWDLNKSRTTCLQLLKTIKEIDQASSSESHKVSYLPADMENTDALVSLPQVVQYKAAVEDICNQKETLTIVENYKKAVCELLNLHSSVS